MHIGYYKSNRKIYTNNAGGSIISNIVTDFNAERFAAWLTEHYRLSRFKNYRDLAQAAGSNPATISRLMNAAPQSATDRPSRPRADLVERLANAFGQDARVALHLAGYASQSDDEIVADGVFSGYYDLTPEQQRLARKQIAAIIRSFTEDDFKE